MSEFVNETIVTRETTDTAQGPQDLIFLANEAAPDGYKHVTVGRVIQGHFQGSPLMDFALSPTVLRKIADLVEGS